MPPTSLSEKVLRIQDAFAHRRIAHAFGGAIALAYYATPRATIDIDVNVFLPVESSGEALGALALLGVEPLRESERVRLERDGQVRLYWGSTPLDLFFSYDSFHESCLERRRSVPFGDGVAIHVLSAEDLTVFKALFNRDKDWRDIDELVFALGEELDAEYVRSWLERIAGAQDERYRRLERALVRHA